MATLQAPRLPLLLSDMQARAKRGATPRVGREIAQVLRRGPGSIEEQFNRQALDSARRGKKSWRAVGDFGTRSSPSSALVRTGGLRSAWLGENAGSITRTAPDSVTIGVSGSSYPQAVPHQEGALVKPKTRIGRDFVMRLFLGIEYGVWITKRRIQQGLRIPPRPVGISRQAISRASQVLTRYLVTGR